MKTDLQTMFAFRTVLGSTLPLYSKQLTLGQLEDIGKGPWDLWTAVYYVAM